MSRLRVISRNTTEHIRGFSTFTNVPAHSHNLPVNPPGLFARCRGCCFVDWVLLSFHVSTGGYGTCFLPGYPLIPLFLQSEWLRLLWYKMEQLHSAILLARALGAGFVTTREKGLYQYHCTPYSSLLLQYCTVLFRVPIPSAVHDILALSLPECLCSFFWRELTKLTTG